MRLGTGWGNVGRWNDISVAHTLRNPHKEQELGVGVGVGVRDYFLSSHLAANMPRLHNKFVQAVTQTNLLIG